MLEGPSIRLLLLNLAWWLLASIQLGRDGLLGRRCYGLWALWVMWDIGGLVLLDTAIYKEWLACVYMLKGWIDAYHILIVRWTCRRKWDGYWRGLEEVDNATRVKKVEEWWSWLFVTGASTSCVHRTAWWTKVVRHSRGMDYYIHILNLHHPVSLWAYIVITHLSPLIKSDWKVILR